MIRLNTLLKAFCTHPTAINFGNNVSRSIYFYLFSYVRYYLSLACQHMVLLFPRHLSHFPLKSLYHYSPLFSCIFECDVKLPTNSNDNCIFFLPYIAHKMRCVAIVGKMWNQRTEIYVFHPFLPLQKRKFCGSRINARERS